MVVNKQSNYRTNEIEKDLRGYLPRLIVETDIPGGDVVFRTNQQPDDQFVQALRQLEMMKTKNLIKNYGVQNSTMDDVFLKITRQTKDAHEPGQTSFDMEQIGLYQGEKSENPVLPCTSSVIRSTGVSFFPPWFMSIAIHKTDLGRHLRNTSALPLLQTVTNILARTHHPVLDRDGHCHGNVRNRVRHTGKTKVCCRISMTHQLAVDSNLEPKQMPVNSLIY